MAKKVYFHGSRDEARQIAYQLSRTLVGKASDVMGIARGIFAVLGFSALGSIQADYVRKMRGGTGEDGVKWKPLSLRTIMARRFGPGEKKQLKEKAGLPKGHRFGVGLDTSESKLTAAQKSAYDAAYKAAFARSMASTGDKKKARQAARRKALAAVRKAGAVLERHVTKKSVFAQRELDILRDTGVLFNSLSPGTLSGTGPNAQYSVGSADQSYKLLSNGVVVGTNVAYAATHQEGTAKIPARPFLPKTLPEKWAGEWLETMRDALLEGARQAFNRP